MALSPIRNLMIYGGRDANRDANPWRVCVACGREYNPSARGALDPKRCNGCVETADSIRLAAQRGEYDCPHCGEVFGTVYDLRAHLRQNHACMGVALGRVVLDMTAPAAEGRAGA